VKFGPVSVADAEGAIAAHALRMGELVLRKGQLIGAGDQDALREAGVNSVIAARLEPGDVGEDEAAEVLARRIAGANLRRERAFTGRVNIFSQANGLAVVDRAAIDRINLIHESITVATLAEHRPVLAGDMVATVKIIPFAAPGEALERALAGVAPSGAVRVAPYRALRIGVVSTLLPGLKASVVAKTLKVMGDRLAPSGARVVRELRVPHDEADLARAIGELASECDAIVVFGASAITDRRDVIPRAIEAIGGRIEHFGMPVDPGNLLLLADLDGIPVLGAPGCARSPKENGFDWVLGRILAGVAISRADIQGMGVGGLLMEIATRPQPRVGDA
jgi:molybdenum cofactor cytidylyltransferase